MTVEIYILGQKPKWWEISNITGGEILAETLLGMMIDRE